MRLTLEDKRGISLMYSLGTVGRGDSRSHMGFYRWFSVALLILLLLTVCFVTLAAFKPSNNGLKDPSPVSETTSLFPVNHAVYVDDNNTTGIIVEVSGSSIPNDAFFTVVTTADGANVPQAAGAPLAVKGNTAIGYYDVKVVTNVTLTPDVTATITITNLNINAGCTMYYWNITQAQWVSTQTQFQPPHTIICTLPAIFLTGMPLGVSGPDLSVGNNSLVAPEYNWGGLMALASCLAALVLIRTRISPKRKR